MLDLGQQKRLCGGEKHKIWEMEGFQQQNW